MIRLYFLLLALLSLLDACGPSPLRAQNNFVVVVANLSGSPEEITIKSALEGVYMTSLKQLVPPKGEAVWVLSRARPDFVEIDSLAAKTAWGTPDWRPGTVLKISYPSASTTYQEWPRAPE